MEIRPTPRNIAEGIQMCIKNAEDFYESAEILFKGNKIRQAYILDSFAKEELGKILLIWNSMFYSDNEKRWKSWEKRFYKHSDKIWFGNDVDDIIQGIIPTKDNQCSAVTEFEKRKNLIYVNINHMIFSKPENVSAEETKISISNTEKKIAFHKNNHKSVEQDIEVIVKCFRLLTGKSYGQLQKMVEKIQKDNYEN